MSPRATTLTIPIRFSADGGFFRTVRARVYGHLGTRAHVGDPRLWNKAVLIAVWFVVSYFAVLSAEGTVKQVLSCISLGVAAAALGLNIFHDANHGSFSANPRINLLLSLLTSALLGASRIFWHYKHHVLHHRFTNIHRWDDDVESRGFLRMSPQQNGEKRYRYQHYFFLVLYAFNTLEWFFVKDFVQYFTLRLNRYQQLSPLSWMECCEFWFCKSIYITLFCAVPFLVYDPARALLGLLLFHVTLSLPLTLVFNLAHATEKVDFPEPIGNPPEIADEWAAHELRTTSNFGTRSQVLNWVAGGLNFQIEHHLFPRICHTYYPDISDLVRCTAAEFGLPYHHYETYFSALRSHYYFLRRLSKSSSSVTGPIQVDTLRATHDWKRQ
jgi:linoleoyl-CoA desaturase